MDIELLRTFLEVNRTRHFGRAADNLHLTAAAVSARIKLLEQQLGVSVFLRQKGNMRLTGEGERLVPHAEAVLQAWLRTVQDVRLQPDVDARLHIGATAGLWQFAMERKLRAVMTRFPELALQAEGHATEELTRLLAARNLDLILLYEPPDLDHIESQKIGELELVLATTEPQVTLNDAVSNGYIYVDWGTSFASFHARALGEKASIALHVNLVSIATSLLKEQPGAAYVPSSVVAATDYLYEVVDAPGFRRSIYGSYLVNNPRAAWIGRVLETLAGVSV